MLNETPKFAQQKTKSLSKQSSRSGTNTVTNKPRREKTGLRDFRPGPTQTGLNSLRR